MRNKDVYLALDVGMVRVGVALADSVAMIAHPLATVSADENGIDQIQIFLRDYEITEVVIGRPRNQSGETTAQTIAVEEFVQKNLGGLVQKISWQDESVTSVIAEERLKSRKKNYSKADIDAEAATIILQDYLEELRSGQHLTAAAKTG